MKKILIIAGVFGILAGCIKAPKGIPGWEVNLNIPAIDTTITMHDLDEKREDVFISGDTVFYGEDTMFYNKIIPNTEIPFVSSKYQHNLPGSLDSTQTDINSVLTRAYYGVYITGRIDDTTSGNLRVTFTTEDGVYADTNYITIMPGNYYNYPLTYELDNIPLGPFTVEVAIDSMSGGGFLDSVKVFYKMPFSARFLGDTLVTILKEIKVPDDIKDDNGNIDEDIKNRYVLHLSVWNLLPVELIASAWLFTKDTQRVYTLLDTFHLPIPPLTNGITQGEEAFITKDIVIPDTFFDYLQDDSVFVKATVIVPRRNDTVFFIAEDYLRMWGYIGVTKYIDPDSLNNSSN